MYFQAYTLYSSVRPFGLSAIIAGWDSVTDESKKSEGVPALYCVEPSGVYMVRSPPSVTPR
jgi:20S proteasome subunit alpha 7